MGGTTEAERDLRRAVAVIDAEVRESSWQQLDLDLMLASLPRAPGLSSARFSAPASGSIRSFPQIGTELSGSVKQKVLRRVPASAIVSIARFGFAPAPCHRARMSFLSGSANDNDVAARHGRSVWRDMFFLMILAATVVGAFWSGRVHGVQKVIVVPGPSSFYSVVT
jgi:hypothetical protein